MNIVNGIERDPSQFRYTEDVLVYLAKHPRAVFYGARDEGTLLSFAEANREELAEREFIAQFVAQSHDSARPAHCSPVDVDDLLACISNFVSSAELDSPSQKYEFALLVTG